MVTINSCLNVGFLVYKVEVQISMSRGYGVKIIGLTDRVVRESKHRILTALHFNSFKVSGQRIIINLSPPDLPKTGMGFDLPIAIGILMAKKFIITSLKPERILFLSELTLNGDLKANQGYVNCVQKMIDSDFEFIVLAYQARDRCTHLNQEKLVYCKNINEVIRFLKTEKKENQVFCKPEFFIGAKTDLDFCQIINQEDAVNAAQVAVLGQHHLILKGNSGLGKSMIAERIPSIATRIDHIDKSEILGIYDLFNVIGIKEFDYTQIPFRRPDHNITRAGLKGSMYGKLIPGEASLAHGGVLFLDELNYFQFDVLRLLQNVLDHRIIQLKKGNQNISLPADFLCVTGFNVSEIDQYPKIISPSLIERFDLCVYLNPIAIDQQKELNKPLQHSKKMSEEINEARKFQLSRNAKVGGGLNSRLNTQQTYEVCRKTKVAASLFQEAVESNNWSFRRQLKVLQLARSIADLKLVEQIDEYHLSKAITWVP